MAPIFKHTKVVFSLASLAGVILKYRVSYCRKIFLYRAAAPNDTEISPVGERPIKINAKVQLRSIFKKCLFILFKGIR